MFLIITEIYLLLFRTHVTINVYTLFVATLFVVTFYVLYLCLKSKIERYGNSVYIWKDCYRKRFCDREKETIYLVQYFTSLINTIIISPRGWGKSSLAKQGRNIVFVLSS